MLCFNSCALFLYNHAMIRAAAYFAALLSINLYICREFFWTPAASVWSMQGFWIAISERTQDAWLHPAWWPYWNCGMPFEFTYAPLLPAMTAALAAMRGVPHAVAFHSIMGAVYIAGPLTLFWAAWMMTRSAGYSFAAAILYSLTSPTQMIVPDEPISIGNFWQAWRLYVTVLWDETPHLAALALLPPSILLVWLAIRRPGWGYPAGAAVLIALATYASVFAPIAIAMASACLIACVEPRQRMEGVRRIALIAVLGYALSAAFLPPSLIRAIATSASASSAESWSAASFTAAAVLVLGWAILWPWIQRIEDAALRFFLLFAYVTSAIPILALWPHHFFLPQPRRYRFEMEMALALALVFALRPWIEKLPRRIRVALVLVGVGLAAEQVVSYRRFAKQVLRAPDITETVEYRAATWADRNLPGTRVMLPSSLAQWADAFAPIDQFSGGSWSIAANPVQQRGFSGILDGDARVTLAWLKAFGVGAIAINGPQSVQYWKPYAHPLKFEGVLPVVWRDHDVTFYRVPQRSSSLAHVVPESALVRRTPTWTGDIEDLDRFTAALDDPSLPLANFRWMTRNRIGIESNSSPGQVIAIQVSYHPGWRARSNGRPIPVHRDALGLMWLECAGPCEITLDYTGGFELNFFRWLSYLTAAGLVAFSLAKWIKLARAR